MDNLYFTANMVSHLIVAVVKTLLSCIILFNNNIVVMKLILEYDLCIGNNCMLVNHSYCDI